MLHYRVECIPKWKWLKLACADHLVFNTRWANKCRTSRRKRPERETLSKCKQPIFTPSAGLNISHYDRLHGDWVIDSEHHRSTYRAKFYEHPWWAAGDGAGSHPIGVRLRWLVSHRFILRVLGCFTFPTQHPIRFAAWHGFFIGQKTSLPLFYSLF